MHKVGQRILVTEKGQSILHEVEEDIKAETELANRFKTQKTNNQRTSQYEDQNSQIPPSIQNTALNDFSNSIDYFRQISTKQQKAETLDMIKNMFYRDEEKRKFPYIIKTVDKYSKKIMEAQSKVLSSADNTIDYAQQSNRTRSIINQYFQDDANNLKNYNQFLNAESRIDRILQRHLQNTKHYSELTEKIKQFHQRQLLDFEKAHLKPVKLQEEVRAENQDLLDALLRETKYRQREKVRYQELHQNKFQKMWGKLKFPKLTQKYQRLQQNKQDSTINEESQEQTQIVSQLVGLSQSQHSQLQQPNNPQ